jgi:hypothetical protein
MTSGSDDIMNKINSLKNEYYLENKKNIIFKNNQKFDCANTIVQNINKPDLFNSIIKLNENQMHINYAMFKTIIHPAIYMDFIYHIFQVNDDILSKYSTYNVFIDCKGLTMTGVERYKDFITTMSLEGQKNKKDFLQKLERIYIVNPPFMIANIGKILLPLLDKVVKEKIAIIPQ